MGCTTELTLQFDKALAAVDAWNNDATLEVSTDEVIVLQTSYKRKKDHKFYICARKHSSGFRDDTIDQGPVVQN